MMEVKLYFISLLWNAKFFTSNFAFDLEPLIFISYRYFNDIGKDVLEKLRVLKHPTGSLGRGEGDLQITSTRQFWRNSYHLFGSLEVTSRLGMFFFGYVEPTPKYSNISETCIWGDLETNNFWFCLGTWRVYFSKIIIKLNEHESIFWFVEHCTGAKHADGCTDKHYS